MTRSTLLGARVRRVRQAVHAECRQWLALTGFGAAMALVLGGLWAGAALYVEFATPADVARFAADAAPGFTIFAGATLLVFLARGVAIGMSDNLYLGERRAARVLAVGMFTIAAVFGLALASGPAAAQTADAPTAPTATEAAGQTEGGYCARRLGTWFYCERPPAPPKPAPKTPDPATPPIEAKPVEVRELEAFQKALDEARQVAVWNPTSENVEKFYLMQRAALDKGGVFADQFRRLTWTNPELDYTLKRPVNELGKHTWEDERNFDRDLFLRNFASQLGIFYVYRESCGACQTFSPIVRNFADRFAVNVKAISTDGSSNPHFRQVMHDRGQLKSWGVTQQTPAILVYQSPSIDPRTGKAIPLVVRGSSGKELRLRPCAKPQGCLTYVGAGVMSVNEIAERLFVLLATEPGQDF